MSQQNNTINFVIHNAKGQPQMVKVIQNTDTQSISDPKSRNTITNVASEETPASFKIAKFSNLKCASKLVQVPTETLARIKQVIPKTEPVDETEEIQDNQEPFTELMFANQTPDVVSFKTEPSVKSTNVSTYNKNNLFLPMSHPTRRRHDTDNDTPQEYTTKRRKNADKVGKGLRHFSMKVCEKVRTKGFTSYNEVADELVLEFAAGMHGSTDSQRYDQKNIRRRVYDALNVLMAMNIISKEKKEIRWLGLPTNSVQECSTLEKEKQTKLLRIQKKTQQLQELILQHISFKSLIERNKEAEKKGIKPSPSSAIHLPFIVVNTSDKALIDCSISNDKTEYMFNFNKRFQIHDDIDILKRMGLLFGLDKGCCSDKDIERAKNMVPDSLKYFVEKIAKGNIDVCDILEEDLEESVEEDSLEADEMEEEQEDVEGNEFSDDSSDVDV